MNRPLAVLLLAVLVVPGCITFDGQTDVEVRVLVTTDVGTTVLTDERVQLPVGSTVLDALREVAVVETSYGGGFVEAIDARSSGYPDERLDWFYHVDASLATVGAASNELDHGDVVAWDHRPWNRTLALPFLLTGLASWPSPPLPSEIQDPSALDAVEGDGRLFARAAGGELVLLDAWGVGSQRLEPPWLLVHAWPSGNGSLDWLIVASSPAAHELLDALDGRAPTGVGIALTPSAALEVPAS